MNDGEEAESAESPRTFKKPRNPRKSCYVCYRKTRHTLSCNHSVCADCWQQHVKKQCGLCRQPSTCRCCSPIFDSNDLNDVPQLVYETETTLYESTTLTSMDDILVDIAPYRHLMYYPLAFHMMLALHPQLFGVRSMLSLIYHLFIIYSICTVRRMSSETIVFTKVFSYSLAIMHAAQVVTSPSFGIYLKSMAVFAYHMFLVLVVRDGIHYNVIRVMAH